MNHFFYLNMKLSNKVPKQFLDYQKKLKSALEGVGVKQKFVYESIGMSKATWNRRNKLYNFTVEEILNICDVVNGQKK